MKSLVLVMTGGAVGAGLRHLVGRAALAAFGHGWPWGTLIVNVSGGLAMGVLAAGLVRVADADSWRLLLGVGVLGGFTTFSSFSLETVAMFERGAWTAALCYVLISVAASIAALAAGLSLTRAWA